MANQSGSETAIPFAKNTVSNGVDQLDAAGQTILQLLHKAAGVAEANSQHALDMAQKLSHQLRAAEQRIAELEAEAQLYQQKSERAEQWLHKSIRRLRSDLSGEQKRAVAVWQRAGGKNFGGHSRASLSSPL
jgi:hypothetical protein